MTYPAQHGAITQPVQSSRRPLTTAIAGNRQPLIERLTALRADIAAIEAAWVAAAEQDLVRNLPRAVRIDDRATWDRATWDRYLAAATAAEPEFKPRLRRLHQQIDSIERLLAAPELPAVQAA